MPIIQVPPPKRGYLKAKRERLRREQEQQQSKRKATAASVNNDLHEMRMMMNGQQDAAVDVNDEADISFAFEGHNRFLQQKKVTSAKSSITQNAIITCEQTQLLEQERNEHQQIEQDLLRQLAVEKQAREDAEAKLKEILQDQQRRENVIANAEQLEEKLVNKMKELEETQAEAFCAAQKRAEYDAEGVKHQALAQQQQQREQYDAVVVDLRTQVSSYQTTLQSEREQHVATQKEWKNKVEAMQNEQADAWKQREEALSKMHQTELEKQKQLQTALEEEYRQLIGKLQNQHEQDSEDVRVDYAKELLALQCLFEQEFKYRQESECERDALSQQLETFFQEQKERKEMQEQQIEQLQSEIQTLQQNLADHDEMQRTLDSTRNELKICKQNLIQEESHFQDCMQTLEEEADNLEKALHTKTTECRELKMELETVKAELNESKTRLVEQENIKATMKTKIQSLREQLSLAEQELSQQAKVDETGNEKGTPSSKPHTPSMSKSTAQNNYKEAHYKSPRGKISSSHNRNNTPNNARKAERREGQRKSPPLDEPAAVLKNHRSKRKRETPPRNKKMNVASDSLLTIFSSLETAEETMTASNKRPRAVTASKQKKANRPKNSVVSSLVTAPLKLFEQGIKNRVTSDSS